MDGVLIFFSVKFGARRFVEMLNLRRKAVWGKVFVEMLRPTKFDQASVTLDTNGLKTLSYIYYCSGFLTYFSF